MEAVAPIDAGARLSASSSGPASSRGLTPEMEFLAAEGEESQFAQKVIALLTREGIIASLKQLRDDCKPRARKTAASDAQSARDFRARESVAPPRERPSLLSFLRGRQEPTPASPVPLESPRLLQPPASTSERMKTPRRMHRATVDAAMNEQISSIQSEQSEAMAELMKEFARLRKRERKAAMQKQQVEEQLQAATAERGAAQAQLVEVRAQLAEAQAEAERAREMDRRLRAAEEMMEQLERARETLQREARTAEEQTEALETEIERAESEKNALRDKFDALRVELEARVSQAAWRASALQDQLAAEHEHAVEAGERERAALERLISVQRRADELAAEAAAERELRRRDRAELQARIAVLEAELVGAAARASAGRADDAESLARARAEAEALRGQLKREKEEADRLRGELERAKEGQASRSGRGSSSFTQKRVEELEGQVAGLQETLGRSQAETASLRLRLQVFEGLRTAAGDEGVAADATKALASERQRTAALARDLDEARRQLAVASPPPPTALPAARAVATGTGLREELQALEAENEALEGRIRKEQERKARLGRQLARAESDGVGSRSPRDAPTTHGTAPAQRKAFR